MYKPYLDLMETEKAIKLIKDNFEEKLAKKLNLVRVSAPLFVFSASGLNDHLSGKERPVVFDCLHMNEEVEIVQSLAKWKRMALSKYNFNVHEGLYTDMNAIRRDETFDAIHSIYVDQWDWEKIILKEERTKSYLKKTVKKIYKVILDIAKLINIKYKDLECDLPKDVTFITTKELEKMYPNLSRKDRENEITKKYKAVFLMQIGTKLSDGKPHDFRAADYDDWKLNGDLLLWYEPLGIAFEISSMGIRVDENSLLAQLKAKQELEKLDLPYVKQVLNKEFPYTIGGGIGQSRLCMYFLKKLHIGEVQASIWPEEMVQKLGLENIELL